MISNSIGRSSSYLLIFFDVLLILFHPLSVTGGMIFLQARTISPKEPSLSSACPSRTWWKEKP
jgi:hypothetical protein